MRILISAFAINPNCGSEEGVGWHFVSRIAQHHDVTVLHGDLRDSAEKRFELESWLRKYPDQFRNVSTIYVRRGRLASSLERLHTLPCMHFLYWASYRKWQKQAFTVARRAHSEQPFHIAHQLTYGTYREPGYLWKLDIPFIWGPVSGRANIPATYLGMFTWRERIEVSIRNALNTFTHFLTPRTRLAAQRASTIFCVTNAEYKFFSRWKAKTSLLLETGAPEIQGHIRQRMQDQPLRIIWSGLHLPRKGLSLLVRAIACLGADAPVQVVVLGESPVGSNTTREAQKLANKCGVDTLFRWCGRVPHHEALEQMQQADVLVHTALAEGTPWVVMEALACGLPVICHDTCGMATAVTNEAGLKVPLRSPKDSVAGFCTCIRRLLEDDGLLEFLSRGALRRSLALGWEHKLDEVLRAYVDARRHNTPTHYGSKTTEKINSL